jgi:hypothetical protein
MDLGAAEVSNALCEALSTGTKTVHARSPLTVSASPDWESKLENVK